MIKAVIFDWAGTTVDYGCMAPVKGFIDAFKSIGFQITEEMAREPMGIAKLDHTRAIAAMLPEPITERQILEAYRVFEETILADIKQYCDVLPHVVDAVASLRQQGIGIGSDTGYTSVMMDEVLPAAAKQGYFPDFCIAPDKVPAGRPYPYMIWQNLVHFGLIDPRQAIKVGDTVADITEGRNANCWTVGVIFGSSELGLTKDQVAVLTADELLQRTAAVRAAYYQAGADYIINDLSELDGVIAAVNVLLDQNAPRKLLTPGPLTTKASVKHAMLTDHCTWDDDYKAITRSVMDDITKISANDDYATVLLQGSGSYAVEAMINCLVPAEDKILFLVNGEYGKRMLSIAQASNRNFEAMSFDMTEPVDVSAVEKKLESCDDIGAVLFVHCETTTGVLNPLAELVKLAKEHDKTVMVDAMSSFAAYEIDVPGLDIDALAASSNKCLEGLPGLSFVIAKKAVLEASEGNSPSHSLDLFDQYQGLYAGGGKFRFTSPTNVLLALRHAIDEYAKEGGLPARKARYIKNHEVLVDGLEALGIHSIVAPEHQSYIISTFELGDLDFARLYSTLKAKGFVIYPGKLTSQPTFRLGNIGDVYPDDMTRLVSVFAKVVRR
ncbi:MAG: 2-aminoethylphosphonate--pyruvate transaminase [Propionibacteriaceae bacterium]|nr:2-aminoethylphosphonate--pyruvate transaminase [Propionibacteriaceae bacterium]